MERRSRHFLLLALVVLVLTIAGRAGRGEEAKKPAESDFELYQIFADTLDQIERNYVKDVSRRELMEAAIEGVLGKLDPYSNYISPDDIGRFKTNVEHQFGGIGIQIGVENGQLKVISPLLGTPAYRAGLESGDWILEIDGKSAEGIQIDEAVRQLKGDADTKVTLTIRHAGSRDKETVIITREVVHVDTVLGDARKSDDSWDFMLDRDKHIGYIRITAFSRDTAADVKKALTELQKEGIRGLILDLRFNPGGLLSSAIEVTDLFVADGTIVSTRGRNAPQRVWEAQKEGTFEGFPIAVLVNHYSASASEILSACLQDHKRAVIIGERTWGKGSVQNVIELEGGKSALKLTTAGYHRPSGKNIHRFPDAGEGDEWGVMPDDGYEVKLNGRQIAQLIEHRRRRDVLVGKHEKALASQDPAASPPSEKPTSDTPTKNEKPAETAPDESKPETTKTEPPKADPAPTQPTTRDESKNDGDRSEPPAPPERTNVKPTDELHEGDEAAAEAKDEDSSGPFVDVQLQKAVAYLSAELAKAQ
ncbi:MAG: S41 family peptidase [Pirellulales bacterium]